METNIEKLRALLKRIAETPPGRGGDIDGMKEDAVLYALASCAESLNDLSTCIRWRGKDAGEGVLVTEDWYK